MRNIIKEKKGGILGSAISNFWAYVMFVFVVLIFFVFFKIQGSDVIQNRIIGLDSQTNADLTLLNYLRTPINDNGQEKIYADFIIESFIESEFDNIDFRVEVEAVTKEYFPATDRAERLMIIFEGGGCLYDSQNRECPLDAGASKGSVRLPLQDLEFGYIDVVLQILHTR